MAMADSTLSCFTTLLEVIPDWIVDLEDILKSAAVKQEEVLFVSGPQTPTRKASKTGSLRSHRSREEGERADSHIQQTSIRPTLPHLTSSDALRYSQRKRKVELNHHSSGPATSRARIAPAIYYDGDTQRRFEKLIRAIGLSRNAIRKGKTSARVDNFPRTGSSSSEGSCSGSDDSIVHKLNYQSTRPSPLSTFPRSNGSEVFDNVDSRLEKAQDSCERAAYQMLKDGDCIPEVTSAKQHFAEALQITESELPALQRKVDSAAERQGCSDRRIMEREMEVRRTANALALKAGLQGTATIQTAVVLSKSSSLEIDPLEADDTDPESESEGEFNVAGLQFGKLLQMRSVGLTAAH